MNECMKEIRTRHSVRKFKNKDVESEKMEAIVEAARLAPSGANKQPWQLIIVKNPQTKERLARISHEQKWMIAAPVFLVVVADIAAHMESGSLLVDENSSPRELKAVIRDAAIVCTHILLEAVHQELGACWVAWYEQADSKRELGIPDDKYVVGIIPIGYADEEPAPRPRRQKEEFMHEERW